MIQLLEPVSPVHILDGAIVSTEAEELLPQLQHRQVLHHVPKNCSTWVKNVDCWTSHCRAKPWVHVGARWPASRQSGILCNPSFLYLKTKLSSEPVQPIFGSNIATGETSQVITSRHFSSLPLSIERQTCWQDLLSLYLNLFCVFLFQKSIFLTNPMSNISWTNISAFHQHAYGKR